MKAPILIALAAAASMSACRSGSQIAREEAVTIDAATAARYEDQVVRSELRERAIAILEDAALSDTAILRAHAIEGLTGAPRRLESVARSALEDHNPGVRAVALMAIGRARLADSAPFARARLGDDDPRVWAAAMFACRANGVPVDLSPLAEMLRDRDVLVRRQAALVLGEIGDPTAAALLEDSLKTYEVADSAQDRLLRLEVAFALVRLGRDDAIHHIRAALHPQTREAVEAAVFAALIAGELRNRDTARQLVEIVETDVPETNDYASLTDPGHTYVYPPELRLAAAHALAEMGYPDGRFVGDTYRNFPEQTIRAQAARLYGTVGDARAIARLKVLLRDDSEYVRVAAASGVVEAIR